MFTKYHEQDIEAPLHFPALMLVLCNTQNYDLVTRFGSEVLDLMSLKDYEFGVSRPMGVERASLNAIAIKCLQNKFNSIDVSTLKRNLFNYAIKNLKYVQSLQREDGGYGTVYTTSLAIHADLSRLVKLPNNLRFNFKKAREWLRNAQQEDGSFGSSLTFTSLAISGLTSR